MGSALQIQEVAVVEAERPSTALPYRKIALWLFATFQFFYLLTSTGRVRTPDEYNTLYTTESLLLHGTTAVPQAVALRNFYGRYDLQGQPRAAYPPGQAILCLPWYALGQYIVAKLPGVPAEDTDLVVAFTSCLSSATFAALTVTFFFLLLVGIEIPLHAALLASAILGLATPLFGYSGWLFSESEMAAIFAGVALLLFGRSRVPISLKTAAVAGLALGLSTLIRPTSVLAIAVFALAILIRDGKAGVRSVLTLGAAAAIGVAILMVHNTILFGGPLSFGYPATAEGAKHLNSFETPFFRGFFGFLLAPGKSVFVFAPPVVLALLGFPRLWQRDRGLAVLAAMLPFAYLLFFSKYTQWEGGYCVGPRYLVPGIVLLCLGLGPVLAENRKQFKVAASVLFATGLLIQCLSLATSFMEDQVPRGHYYDASWTYRMGYSLSGPVHLLFKYLASDQPAKLGLGWDRWFVFLAKGGLSPATLAAIGILMLVGFAFSLTQLVRTLKSARTV